MCGNQLVCYIGLGSNIGDREKNIKQAVEMLRQSGKVNIKAVSSFYNTKPVGYTSQPDFLNAVVGLSTSLPADKILELCAEIEKELKRERIIHWGPRTIDLDILLYGNAVINTDKLIVPHPRMHEREFVLIPLNEIAPDIVHPVFKKTINELLNKT